ncbi:MAG: hypothetical protein VB817_03535 [Pirellulaceae bacterium]
MMKAKVGRIVVVLLLVAATPAMAKKRDRLPVIVENPVIGDLDANGIVDMDEARALMQNPGMKRELFDQNDAEQERFYLSLEKKVRLQLVKLSRAHGTLRWEYAIDRARQKGLSAIDAERIALALRE